MTEKTLFKDSEGKLHIRFSEQDTSGPRKLFLDGINETATEEIRHALELSFIKSAISMYDKDVIVHETIAPVDININELHSMDNEFKPLDQNRLDFICSYYSMLLWKIINTKQERGEAIVFDTDISHLESDDIALRCAADMGLLLDTLKIQQRDMANKTLFSCIRSVYNIAPKDAEGYVEFVIDDLRNEFSQGSLFRSAQTYKIMKTGEVGDLPRHSASTQTYKIMKTGEVGDLPCHSVSGNKTTYMTDVCFENGLNAIILNEGGVENAPVVVQHMAKQDDVKVYVSLECNHETYPAERIDGTDWLLFEAIGNIYLGNGERTKVDQFQHSFVSTEQIVKEMRKKYKGQIRADSVDDIHRRMQRWANTRITISYEQQAKALHMKGGENKAFIRGAMLLAVEIELQMYGTTERGWKITDVPIVYSYASTLGRIMTVPKNIIREGSIHVAKIQRALFQLMHNAKQERLAKKARKRKMSNSASMLLYTLIRRADYPFEGKAPADRRRSFFDKIISEADNILRQMKEGAAISSYEISGTETPAKCKITVRVDEKDAETPKKN